MRRWPLFGPVGPCSAHDLSWTTCSGSIDGATFGRGIMVTKHGSCQLGSDTVGGDARFCMPQWFWQVDCGQSSETQRTMSQGRLAARSRVEQDFRRLFLHMGPNERALVRSQSGRGAKPIVPTKIESPLSVPGAPSTSPHTSSSSATHLQVWPLCRSSRSMLKDRGSGKKRICFGK